MLCFHFQLNPWVVSAHFLWSRLPLKKLSSFSRRPNAHLGNFIGRTSPAVVEKFWFPRVRDDNIEHVHPVSANQVLHTRVSTSGNRATLRKLNQKQSEADCFSVFACVALEVVVSASKQVVAPDRVVLQTTQQSSLEQGRMDKKISGGQKISHAGLSMVRSRSLSEEKLNSWK